MAGQAMARGERTKATPSPAVAQRLGWTSAYQVTALAADGFCALVAGCGALLLRFGGQPNLPLKYVAASLALPLLWWMSVAIAHGYDDRVIGLGADEFRRVLNAGIGLTAGIAIVAYLAKDEIARGWVLVALPGVTGLDIGARYLLRKRLHRQRRQGESMHRAIAVGHARAVADLVGELRRDSYHGLSVVGACVAEWPDVSEIAGVPVAGGMERVVEAVADLGADTVAVLACRELDGTKLRELAWQLEVTRTELCVAPALLDVAGPRTTIRPAAGLPLLHVDHPTLAGPRLVVKSAFDKVAALLALILLTPFLAAIAVIIRLSDGGPALFRQTRVGKDGRLFGVYKFRTMVVGAERQRLTLVSDNLGGPLFKMRKDPRVTPIGAWLRRWSLDELPQLVNVLRGSMSLVGPRPALPEEAEHYGSYVRRRLAVTPGLTGLWQVSGRADLLWEEAVRLDLRYVENWSLALDLQIIWKTFRAVVRGHGAY